MNNGVYPFDYALLITPDLLKMLMEIHGLENPCISKQLLGRWVITY